MSECLSKYGIIRYQYFISTKQNSFIALIFTLIISIQSLRFATLVHPQTIFHLLQNPERPCPPHLFFNSFQCIQCSHPKYFSTQSLTCNSCPPGKIYDKILNICINCPQQYPYLSFDKCVKCGQYEYWSEGRCLECGGWRKFDGIGCSCEGDLIWDGQDCVICVHPYYFDQKSQKCQICEHRTIYDMETKMCKSCPPDYPIFQDYQCQACKLPTHYNPVSSKCQCPERTMLKQNSCEPCYHPQYYNQTMQACTQCPDHLVYNLQTSQCTSCPQQHPISNNGRCEECQYPRDFNKIGCRQK